MRNGMTELPTLPGDLEELQRVLQRIARRLDKVPFDSIGEELNQSLKSLHQTLDGMRKLSENMDGKVLPQAVKTLEDLQKTLESTRQTMRVDSPLQQDRAPRRRRCRKPRAASAPWPTILTGIRRH